MAKNNTDNYTAVDVKKVTFGNMNNVSSSSASGSGVSWNEPSSSVSSSISKSSFDLITHPILVDVPKSITCNNLYNLIDPFVPYPFPYSLHYVKHDVSLRHILRECFLLLISFPF